MPPTPETEASVWLEQSFIASYCSSSTTTAPINNGPFLSLLAKPFDTITNPPSSTPPTTKRVMFIQTLPGMVQSRILSFLVFKRQRFSARNLNRLARDMFFSGGGGGCVWREVDFWVKGSACNPLDVVSEPGFEWISSFSSDSGGEQMNEKSQALPGWLKDAACDNETVLPWLPVSPDDDELDSITAVGPCVTNRQSCTQVIENGEGDFEEARERI